MRSWFSVTEQLITLTATPSLYGWHGGGNQTENCNRHNITPFSILTQAQIETEMAVLPTALFVLLVLIFFHFIMKYFSSKSKSTLLSPGAIQAARECGIRARISDIQRTEAPLFSVFGIGPLGLDTAAHLVISHNQTQGEEDSDSLEALIRVKTLFFDRFVATAVEPQRPQERTFQHISYSAGGPRIGAQQLLVMGPNARCGHSGFLALNFCLSVV
jgi:hypothetical protein